MEGWSPCGEGCPHSKGGVSVLRGVPMLGGVSPSWGCSLIGGSPHAGWSVPILGNPHFGGVLHAGRVVPNLEGSPTSGRSPSWGKRVSPPREEFPQPCGAIPILVGVPILVGDSQTRGGSPTWGGLSPSWEGCPQPVEIPIQAGCPHSGGGGPQTQWFLILGEGGAPNLRGGPHPGGPRVGGAGLAYLGEMQRGKQERGVGRGTREKRDGGRRKRGKT